MPKGSEVGSSPLGPGLRQASACGGRAEMVGATRRRADCRLPFMLPLRL